MADEIVVLANLEDRILAENIQRILEENGIHALLQSDNPASSALNIYMGSVSHENISIKLHKDAYKKATEIIRNSGFGDLLEDCDN
ncbi:putative signal transducing protein [Alkalitalea saponilacus]|uniref:Putative signal transducing protein n=1 Tax=Alkalitalea saponilacus TaxID=889453 RepID=A0A1T5HT87_9BACT|nr:DUF2007 domain-containing protein [Alkalitalea saponilacus]ASB49244.1 hypothetical protein CDL62_08885 [Alkalitalea saponilacus]SKC23730.1 Putative signal transducing protein [Alkalitalea saponilacus]